MFVVQFRLNMIYRLFVYFNNYSGQRIWFFFSINEWGNCVVFVCELNSFVKNFVNFVKRWGYFCCILVIGKNVDGEI